MADNFRTYQIAIRAGDSTAIYYVKADDIDAADTICYHRVVRGATQLLAPTQVTDTAIVGSTTYFRVFLTPTLTASMGGGAPCDWIVQLNAFGEDPPFSKEWTLARLQISSSRLTPP